MSFLTKSDYLRYLECPIHLWLHKHRQHEAGHHVDPQTQWIFEQGNIVETYARSLFPKAAMVKGHTKKSEEQTRSLIEEGKQTIFQATATADGLLAMADIMKFDPEAREWNLYEVKSSTEIDDVHYRDVCFQMIAFKKAGYAIGRLHLIHVNPDYIRQGDIDPSAFLVIEDITEQAYAREAEVLTEIASAKQIADCADVPSCDGCTCSPKDCPCHQYCYPDLPEYSVFQLYRVKVKQARELYRKGMRNLLDLPHDFKLTKAQQLQLQAARTGKPVIDTTSIQHIINTATYPIAFLDYETFFPAVPLFDGYKPYQQMVFQYSLHILSEDGTLQHAECLVRSLQDPVPEILYTLKSQLPANGTIVVWNKGFEMGRNNEMAALLPEYAVFLQSLNNRVFDLMEVFRQQHYVHPDFRGSCSIKKVLPVLVPTLSYKDLVIQEGGTASLTWYRMLTDGRSENDKTETCNHLLSYCKLDTLAMVEVFRHLKTMKSD
jgi:hypothetical protein